LHSHLIVLIDDVTCRLHPTVSSGLVYCSLVPYAGAIQVCGECCGYCGMVTQNYCDCFLDIFGHGCFYGAGCIIPFEGGSAVKFAFPVGGGLVQVFDG
jgi:hypothetical protein